jgi:Ca2+-binding RTX toxin-like protein
MATYVSYTPTGTFAKALFNFDSIAGHANFKYSGTVYVTVSGAFSQAQYQDGVCAADVYTSSPTGWSAGQIAQLNLITATYSNFINLQFSSAVDHSATYNPYGVGINTNSNINVSIIDRADLNFGGKAALDTDFVFGFGYAQARGDIVVNQDGVGGDVSFDPYSFGFHTLMHEIGHSLGLSHPHSAWNGGFPTITADYAATASLGFAELGFQIDSALDMYKEYFSIMSYDDQAGGTYFDTFAQTPMILDVLALQAAYGAGPGTSGAGNSTIKPGGDGGVDSYRTYFDTGGNDTIDVGNYSFVGGAYLHMGTTITGAPHRVGVSMSLDDADAMFGGGDPASLRWYYGEFENAQGTSLGDLLIGNSLANVISGQGGGDAIDGWTGKDSLNGGGGNDSLYGGAGNDRLTGNAGADRFVFDAKLGSTNKDTVTDFVRGTDKVALDDDLFRAFAGATTMVSGKFYLGAAAHDPSDRVIYNPATGTLFYDPDGTGPAAQTAFAVLGASTHPQTITYADFVIVA